MSRRVLSGRECTADDTGGNRAGAHHCLRRARRRDRDHR